MTRDEFEQFISSPPIEQSIDRWPENVWLAHPGKYRDYAVQLAWEVLQEAMLRAQNKAGC